MFTNTDLMSLTDKVMVRHLAKDEILFREGEESHSLYLIHSGQIEIYTHDKNHKKLALANCGPKEMIGEMAFIDGSSRSAWAVALEPTTVFEIPTDKLKAQLEAEPVWIRALIESLISRLRLSKKKLKERA